MKEEFLDKSVDISLSQDTSEFLEDEEDTKAKKSLLAALLVSLASSQVVYSNIATFLPPYRTEKHPELSDFSIGVILA